MNYTINGSSHHLKNLRNWTLLMLLVTIYDFNGLTVISRKV